MKVLHDYIHVLENYFWRLRRKKTLEKKLTRDGEKTLEVILIDGWEGIKDNYNNENGN